MQKMVDFSPNHSLKLLETIFFTFSVLCDACKIIFDAIEGFLMFTATLIDD